MSFLMVLMLATLLPFPALVGVLAIERIREGRRDPSRLHPSTFHGSA